MPSTSVDVDLRAVNGPHEAEAAAELLARIWSQRAGLGPEVIRALEHSGNCVLGAFDSDRLVGVVVGVLSLTPGGLGLHSHVLGVDPAERRRHLGLALKLEQRDWALARGIDRIVWTTDPLVRGNAYLNIVKLGARVTSYEEGFYGDRSDAINAGDETDRVVVEWDLRMPVPSGEPTRTRGCVVLGASDAGEPLPGPAAAGPGPRLLAIPDDIVAMRRADPARARRWRVAVREALTGELAARRHVVGMTADGSYLTEETT